MEKTKPAALAALAAAGALVCGIAWALSSPVGSAPDDHYHLTSIWCAAGADTELCSAAGTHESGKPLVTVPGMIGTPSCYAGNNQASAACQRDLPRTVTTLSVNTSEYPGGFYRVLHLLAGDQFGGSVVAMRSLNVGLAVLLLGAVAIASPPVVRRLQLYVLTTVLVPLGWFILASVNPSSWAMTGVTTFGFALHSYFLVDTRRRRLLLAGAALVGVAMGAAARGDAAVYVVLVAVAIGLLHWRTLRSRPRLGLLVIAAFAVSAVGALNAHQLAGPAGAAPETDRTSSDVIVNLAFDFPTLVSGLFGYGPGLGWLDTYVHSLTAFSVVVVVGFLFLSGIGLGGRAKAASVLFLGVAMLAIPLQTLYRARLIVGEAVQPRYLLPVVPVLFLLLLTGPRPWQGLLLSRAQAMVMGILLAAANSAALYVNIQRYVTGTDGPVIIGPAEWWWPVGPGPLQVWLLGSIGFAVFAAAIVVVSGVDRHARSSPLPRADRTRATPVHDSQAGRHV